MESWKGQDLALKIVWSEYGILPREAMLIRTTVFVDEQGFQDEFDKLDEKSWHLVIYEADVPIATGRMYRENDHEMHLGRIAVIKPERGKNIGYLVLGALEDKARAIGASSLVLGAQKQVEGFYRKAGFRAFGDEYMEEGCPHIHMKKMISRP